MVNCPPINLRVTSDGAPIGDVIEASWGQLSEFRPGDGSAVAKSHLHIRREGPSERTARQDIGIVELSVDGLIARKW